MIKVENSPIPNQNGFDKSFRQSLEAISTEKSAFNREETGAISDDNWIKDIGKNERQVLPSGAILLTGKAAEKKALEIAKQAWIPPDELKQKSDDLGGKLIGLRKYETVSLKELLEHDPKENNILGRQNKTYVLGVYNDIIITTKSSYIDQSEISPEVRQKLLADVVKSLEKGALLKSKAGETPGKNLLDKMNGKYYPLVINASNEMSASRALSAERGEGRDNIGKTFDRNFDVVNFFPKYAIVNNLGQIVPPWSALFHEFFHVQEYNQSREKYLQDNKGKTISYPKGNWVAGDNYVLETYTLDKEKAVPDHEHRADEFQRILCDLANVPARKNYLDVKETILVDDPINPTPVKTK
ncbi:MAG: hypothetical protein V4691_05060 [Pseudomonadota bacterium]